MPVALEGKEAALKRLEIRRAENKNRKPVRNETLQAGEDMHFGCDTCNADIAMPEDYTPPRPRNCPPCTVLIKNGWLN